MKKLWRHFTEWIKAIGIAVLLIIVVRFFFFEMFAIPSSSMEGQLLTGDYIVVNKLAYGPRTPITPLSIPFVQNRLPFDNSKKSYLDNIEFPYFRLGDINAIQHNDIIVFNYPIDTSEPTDHKSIFVKRCMAIAGDTLKIKKGIVYVNNKNIDTSQHLQYNYHIQTTKAPLDSLQLGKYNISTGGILNKKGDYWLALNKTQIDSLENLASIKSITPLLEKHKSYNDFMFPDDDRFVWNLDNFGPLYIPRAGDSIKINTKNISLYLSIITLYEKNTLSIANDSIFINGEHCISYTFKMNYYFMMGDNRHHSADSRFWGFLPEDHILGKASSIILSINKGTNTLRWKRFFKKL